MWDAGYRQRPGAGRKSGSGKTAPKPVKPLTPFQLWSADPERAIAELCNEIVSGTSLNRFVNEHGLVYSTVREWIEADAARAAKYGCAREDRSDAFADQIIAISDDSKSDTYIDPETGGTRTDHEVVARARLRVDARKWLASKMKPRVYGDKLELDAKVELSYDDRLKALNDMVVPAHAAVPTFG